MKKTSKILLKDFLLWGENNYIHKTKHDGMCGYKKDDMDSSR